MSSERRYRHTMRYIRAHWPIYFGLYGGLIGTLVLIGLALAFEWYSLIPFSLAIMIIVAYFLAAYAAVAYLINDAPGGRAAEILFDLANTQPDNRVVCIDLGLRETAVSVARHLTTGQVTVIDIYNPQSNVGGPLKRARANAPRPPHDPRLVWIDGSIDLLPLPDRSVQAVYLNQILSEFWMIEERERLLEEVRRILIPEGRLLLAEPIRARSNLLLAGIVTAYLPTAEEWRVTLTRAGFVLRRHEFPRGVLYCARYDKPSPTAGKQMQLKLEYV